MIRLLRNGSIGIALVVVAVLLVALIDGAFQNFLPQLSSLRVGSTDLATCVVMVTLTGAFVVAGYLCYRWISGRFGALWVVAPVLVVYALSIFQTPYVYRCNPSYFFFACALAHLPFVIGILATSLGYLASKSVSRVAHVV